MKTLSISALDFNKEKGTVLAKVTLDANDFDCMDFVLQNQFNIKNEFHLTVVGFYEGKQIAENESMRQKIGELVNKYNKESSLECDTEGEVLFIEKEYKDEHRFSLITPCNSNSLDAIRKEIDDITGNKSVPYWHVTLATRDGGGKSHDGIAVPEKDSLLDMSPKLVYKNELMTRILKFMVPTRIQPDTSASIFLLQEYAEKIGYSLDKDFTVEINPKPQESFWQSMSDGTMQLDCIGGLLDHHGSKEKTTLTELVKRFVHQKGNPSLEKISAYTQRDDFHGKGTISTDMLDKAFGLSGILTAFNKVYPEDPTYIVKSILPLYKAHYEEERKRNEHLPKLVKQLKEEGKISEQKTKQRKKKIDIIFVESDESSLPGYLRSSIGGRYDIVVQRRATGHTNIITRPLKSIDIRSLVALVRKSELLINKKSTDFSERYLSGEGIVKEVPQWYYDRATNTLQNGGLNEGGVIATSIPFAAFKNIIEAGISEKYWNPLAR